MRFKLALCAGLLTGALVTGVPNVASAMPMGSVGAAQGTTALVGKGVEQVGWRGRGWRGYGWRGYRGYGWRGYGWRPRYYGYGYGYRPYYYRPYYGYARPFYGYGWNYYRRPRVGLYFSF